ncbi:unnamed protein product [Macrosiphum euphorbiae]|uniref:Tc1-like transposase DDE domain-containing protein n=1 Tax=Macrosiphum euphorbiae TaxID=13131 RepID=A0AAV0Y181_9HEMI|nr:unnamed protein product [Macrosiphum euphorbiae]
MDNMEDVANISPCKKNPKGKFVGTGQKNIIINVYKDKIKQQLENPEMPKLSFRELIVSISKTTGIGQRTIQTTLGEYKKEGTVSSPNKKKVRPTVLQKVDEFDKNVIRQKIHNFWRNREVPTISKMLIAINEDDSLPNLKRTSFQLILKDLQFEYVKRNRNSALLEREDLISWRRNYVLKIRHYRAQNRPIYYLDETWVNAGETHSRTWVDTTVASTRDAHLRGLTTGQKAPSGKGKRLIVLHIGSSDGFVPGGLLCFESKTNSADYHDEMNGDTFYEWFVKTLPLLKPNAIIVMDNASYHSVKKQKIPVRSWKKQAIIDWLESKGVIVTHPIVKNDLMKKVYKIKKHHDTYVIDEYAKDNGTLVLRLPPYHCELNPIELAWSSVKSYVRTHNNTFKLKDVMELLKKGVEHVSPDMWKNFIEHVKKVEDKFWDLEHITDELMDELHASCSHYRNRRYKFF